MVDKIHSPTPETVQRQEMGDEDEVRLKSEAGSGGTVEAGVGVTGVRKSRMEGVRVNRKVNSEGETQKTCSCHRYFKLTGSTGWEEIVAVITPGSERRLRGLVRSLAS